MSRFVVRAFAIALATAGAWVDAPAAPAAPAAPPPALKEVIVVFKTHFDIGFTDMAVNVVQRYRTTMIDQALKVVDASRELPPSQQFVWTIPGWPAQKIMEDWPGQSAQRQERIRRAFQDGRFVVHALPFTTHTELLEPEDLVRGMGYSSRLARKLGLELPRDAKMTDVPEHSWMIPTLLKHAGVDFMAIGCNGASAPLRVPTLFWWEGPDGSRVLTLYSIYYGTDLIPPANWPYRTWLAVIHTGDNRGPPAPADVQKLLARATTELPGVKVRIGRMSDFADAILAEHPDLPVVRGDAPDTWIHGPMSDPQGARLARNTRPLITAAEALNTELRGWGVRVSDATSAVGDAYEQSLLYGEHTWGGSIGWIKMKLSFGDEFERDRIQGRYQRSEASWDEHSRYIESARKTIVPVLDENLSALARAVNTSGRRIVVYNPLPWSRDGIVDATLTGDPIAAFRAIDGGEPIPVESNRGKLRFVVRDVPAMGYRTFVATAAAPARSPLRVDQKAATIESPFFNLALDPQRGTVRSFVDRRSGREWVDPASAHGLGQYLHERFDLNQVEAFAKGYLKGEHREREAFRKPGLPPATEVAYVSVSPRNFDLRFEQTPVSVAAVMEAKGEGHLPKSVTLRVVLYRDLPCADLEITLQDKPADTWPEGGWLCLPFRIDQPRFHLGRLGSIIDPARDVIPGANRHLFGLNTGLAMTDAAGDGIGLCPLDHPLVSLDVPGLWKFSLDFVPKRPVAYLNLFNNQWSTNFRLWNEGTWSSRVRVWSISRYDPESGLTTPALEARFPLAAATVEGAAGKLPVRQTGVEIAGRGALVTAFGANPDGTGIVLRLWEHAGRSGVRDVRLPAGFAAKSAQPVDLRGRPIGEPIPIHDGRFSCDLRAFAPASFVLAPP